MDRAGTTWQGLLQEGVSTLSSAMISNAWQEAMWLMEWGLQASRLEIWLNGDRLVTTEQRDRVRALFVRRAAREPLQYILGTQEFCGLEFVVQPGVLIPRPETAMLVHELLRAPLASLPRTIADIGTGSGCLAVSLARAFPEARLYATDRSEVALGVAHRNAIHHGVDDRVVFLAGDLLAPLRGMGLEGKWRRWCPIRPTSRTATWRDSLPKWGDSSLGWPWRAGKMGSISIDGFWKRRTSFSHRADGWSWKWVWDRPTDCARSPWIGAGMTLCASWPIRRASIGWSAWNGIMCRR